MASTDTGERRRTYTEWYVWAARNLSSTGEVRHACAKAAMDAKEDGGDPAAAARAAAQNRSGPGWTDEADPSIRAYAEWYDWARITLKLSGEPLHDAAAAALAEIEGGGDATAAARAAGLTTAGAQTLPETPPPPTPPTPQMPPPPMAPPPAAQPEASPAPSMVPYGAGIPPPAASPPAYPYGLPAYPTSAPAADRRPGPFGLPSWVIVLLGFGGGISLLQIVDFVTAVVLNPYPLGQLFAAILSVISLIMFASTFVALLGVIRGAAWARAMTIVAGVALCFAVAIPLLFYGPLDLIVAGVCVGLGLAVIVGAATAKPAVQRS